MNDIQLGKPVLAKCIDRSQEAYDPVKPDEIISQALKKRRQICSTFSFNFFINWEEGKFADHFWFTRLLKYKQTIPSVEQIKQAFMLSDHYFDLLSLSHFAIQFGVHVNGVVLPEPQNITEITENTPAWMIELREGKNHLNVQETNLKELQEKMAVIRGNRFTPMGRKGLNYGSSAVECWLSTRGNIYPGDCDLLLACNNQPKLIVEFKKHTKRMQPIEDHLAEKYYNNGSDFRKYESLFLLRDFFEEKGITVPILVVYYSVNPVNVLGEYQYRIQEIRRVREGSKSLMMTTKDTGTKAVFSVQEMKEGIVSDFFEFAKGAL